MLEYATLKEADLLMRRAKEEERFAARQAQRQKMIDEGVRQLADLNVVSVAAHHDEARGGSTKRRGRLATETGGNGEELPAKHRRRDRSLHVERCQNGIQGCSQALRTDHVHINVQGGHLVRDGEAAEQKP